MFGFLVSEGEQGVPTEGTMDVVGPPLDIPASESQPSQHAVAGEPMQGSLPSLSWDVHSAVTERDMTCAQEGSGMATCVSN